MRILPGENHPRVFCSQGNGGVPCAAPFHRRPEPPGVGLDLVDDQRLSLQHPDSRNCLGPLGFPRESDEQLALFASSCRGRFAFRQPFPGPFGNIPSLERLRMPTSCALRLEVFRMVLENQIQRRPSPKSASTHVEASMLPKQRWPKPVGGGASFVSDWDKSRWAPGPTHSQGAFSSEDGSVSPSRPRSGGLSITSVWVSPRDQRHPVA